MEQNRLAPARGIVFGLALTAFIAGSEDTTRGRQEET
jgi:hypothetical protein